MRGTLFLIVGPSGAGKDTLIAAVRPLLGDRYVFPRRMITREVGPGEVHDVESVASFEARERAGGFALAWRAHGLAYGVPASIADVLRSGHHVVVNVSRTVVAGARARYAPACVVLVTASPAVLVARLRARGREEGAAIAARLGRAHEIEADAVIVNDGPLETAVAAFLAALKG